MTSSKISFKKFMDMCFKTSEHIEKQQSQCGCTTNDKFTQVNNFESESTCSNKQCGCSSTNSLMSKKVNRRQALSALFGAVAVSCSTAASSTSITQEKEKKERKKLEWEEYFKGNYRLMNDSERKKTIERLERISELKKHKATISGQLPQKNVLYGYAFNISKCRGYQDCIRACVKENNLDRKENMQYIRIFEMENGNLNLEDGKADYFHEVPKDGHFYLGTQCFQCDNPPCVKVCPVGATWKEEDGIVVIDYDWCIGCRYCQAACPYWARRFNWQQPEVPSEQLNPDQHYLSNRPRRKGVMEKCTYCLQRTRKGLLPACAEACPTGARIFGNLLDPNSEIRYVLENKKVFRLKEELGTEPKFWYFMD